MPQLTDAQATELLRNTGIIGDSGAGAGLRAAGIGLGAAGMAISAEEEKAAVAQAHIEGNNAVTRDPQGRLVIESLDFSDPVHRARTSAAINRYLDEHALDARKVAAENATLFKQDPEGFQSWASGVKSGIIAGVPDALKGRVAGAYDQAFNQTYTGLLTSKSNHDYALANHAFIQAGAAIKSDILALADQGMLGTDAFAKAINDYQDHQRRGVESGFLNEDSFKLAMQQTGDESEARALAAFAVKQGRAAFASTGSLADAKAAVEDGIDKLKDPSLSIPEERRRLAASIAHQEIDRFGAIHNSYKAEAARARVLEDRAKREAQNATQGSFLQRLRDPANPAGMLTTNEILQSNLDPFGQGSQETFLNLMQRQASGADLNTTDPRIYRDLRREVLDGKIKDPREVLDYVSKGLSIGDYQRLETEIDQGRTAQGRADQAAKKRFLDFAEKQITGSNSFLGIRDIVGDQRAYEFEFAVNSAIGKGIAEGKSLQSMLDPRSKDYLGPMIDQARRTPAERLRDQAAQFRASPPSQPADVPARKPGETIGEWRQRTGK